MTAAERTLLLLLAEKELGRATLERERQTLRMMVDGIVEDADEAEADDEREAVDSKR